jgi:hypothetical protein
MLSSVGISHPFCASLFALSLIVPLGSVRANADGLIPRKDLIGNDTRGPAIISPDGKHIGYIGPRDGVLNVFVAPRSNLKAARPVTDDT